MTMMNNAQSVLASPPRSALRNRSPKIHHRHMNQAKKMKNSNIANRNEPLLSNNWGLLFSVVPTMRLREGGGPHPTGVGLADGAGDSPEVDSLQRSGGFDIGQPHHAERVRQAEHTGQQRDQKRHLK